MNNKLQDSHQPITIESQETAFKGFRQLDNLTYREQGASQSIAREVVTGKMAVAVIAYDPVLEKLVLIHQFRLAAQMGTGYGFTTEIVAGLMDEGEEAQATALRELTEETGLIAHHIEPLCQFLTTPGMTDEVIYLFYAKVDASTLTTKAGHELEDEQTFPFLASFDETMAAIDDNKIYNGITILALLWFARHRTKLIGERP